MRKIWAIQWLHMKEFFRTPSVWMLMVLMPAVFSFIFGGMAFNSETQKPVIDIVESQNEVSPVVVDLLKRNAEYQWETTSEKQAKENVVDQKVVAAVVLPENIYDRLENNQPLFDILVERKSEHYLGLTPFLQGVSQVIVTSFEAVDSMSEGKFVTLLKNVSANSGIDVEQKVIQKEAGNETSVDLMFIGFAIMFMMFGISGAASTILDEKSGGTWERLLVAPVRKHQISFGYLGAYFCMGWLQLIILMVTMTIFFDASWGKLSYLIPFSSLVILCVVGFGLMIAGLVKTKQQAIALTAILVVSTCMLGGVYWPLDFVPLFMQKMALAVPQSWMMSGFEEIISGSLHLPSLLVDTLALVGFSTVFFLIGLRLIRYD